MPMMRALAMLSTLACASASSCMDASGATGPCMPGREFCGKPFTNAPMYHLMDQHGCGENDPNGPVFDPVHGVIHHFYQIHLSAAPGHGPDYGHFVSKDFINWAPLGTAIWNGLDSSVSPPRVTKYDNEAIFTGSAVVVNGAGPGGVPGVVNIYPGLCNKNDWPACETGTLLAQAVPANYATDELLVNWTKPSYNPIMENTQRDPSSPWKTPSGEWRLRTYNQHVYAAASDEAMLAGKWTDLGVNKDFRGCECPSFYPLPSATPGFEAQYEAARQAEGGLPTHVHKTSCGGDWWQLGSYEAGKPGVLGHFNATPGWEDVWEQKKIDQGHFYASKDNSYPTLDGGTRRINWGWATVPPASTQTLPRVITFNAAARQLEQTPIEELLSLRAATPAFDKKGLRLQGGQGKSLSLSLPQGVTKQSELLVNFTLPKAAATLSVSVGKPAAPPAPAPAGTPVASWMNATDMPGDDYSVTHHPPSFGAKGCQADCLADAKCQAWTWVVRGSGDAGSGDCCKKTHTTCPGHVGACTSGAKKPATLPSCGGGGGGGGGASLTCSVEYKPMAADDDAPYNEVSVSCGGSSDTLRLLPGESSVSIRIFSDATFVEAYFQGGRVAMTEVVALDASSDYSLASSLDGVSADALAYPLRQIWVTPDAVRAAPRVYK